MLNDNSVFSLSKNIHHYHVTIYQEVSLSIYLVKDDCIYLVNDNWAACAAYLDPPTVQRDIFSHHLSVNLKTFTTLNISSGWSFGVESCLVISRAARVRDPHSPPVHWVAIHLKKKNNPIN